MAAYFEPKTKLKKLKNKSYERDIMLLFSANATHTI
jgi:hypothetical protein